VTLADYIKDPTEAEVWDSWVGVEELISWGAEEHFGLGTEKFLREAHRRQKWMRGELMRRYGLSNSVGELEEEIK